MSNGGIHLPTINQHRYPAESMWDAPKKQPDTFFNPMAVEQPLGQAKSRFRFEAAVASMARGPAAILASRRQSQHERTGSGQDASFNLSRHTVGRRSLAKAHRSTTRSGHDHAPPRPPAQEPRKINLTPFPGLSKLRHLISRATPLVNERWRLRVAACLGLDITISSRGRPRKKAQKPR